MATIRTLPVFVFGAAVIVGLFITVYGLREEGRLSNSLSAISSVGRGWRSQQTEETEIGRAANETLGVSYSSH